MDWVSSAKIVSLHLSSTRNIKFFKAHRECSLIVESIDLDSWTSCFRPPHWMNVVLWVIKSTTMLLIASRAATCRFQIWKKIHQIIWTEQAGTKKFLNAMQSENSWRNMDVEPPVRYQTQLPHHCNKTKNLN